MVLIKYVCVITSQEHTINNCTNYTVITSQEQLMYGF